MKLRTLTVYVVILAALAGLVYVLQRPAPPPSADARLGQALVAPALVEKAAKLRITDQGKSVTVVRQSDDIAQIEVPFADGGPITFSRAKKDAEWTADKTPAGQKVKADKISSVLTSVDSVRFSDTNDLTDEKFIAAKANARAFKLTTF